MLSTLRKVVPVLVTGLLVFSLFACAPASTADEGIVIVIPEDPPSFNPVTADTGYDSLVMELTMLGMTDIDPMGNVFPELAAELPTQENGDVVVNEDEYDRDMEDASGCEMGGWDSRYC